jgi:hypothetical protein
MQYLENGSMKNKELYDKERKTNAYTDTRSDIFSYPAFSVDL